MVGWHHWVDGHEFEQALVVGDGQGGLEFLRSQRVKHDWGTELNWIFHCIYVAQLPYSFVCWWTSRLLPCPNYPISSSSGLSLFCWHSLSPSVGLLPWFLSVDILPEVPAFSQMWKSFSRVRLFVNTWTVAYQAPPSMGFSRQECWSGLPFPSPGDLPDPEIEPRNRTQVSCTTGRFFTNWTTRKTLYCKEDRIALRPCDRRFDL